MDQSGLTGDVVVTKVGAPIDPEAPGDVRAALTELQRAAIEVEVFGAASGAPQDGFEDAVVLVRDRTHASVGELVKGLKAASLISGNQDWTDDEMRSFAKHKVATWRAGFDESSADHGVIVIGLPLPDRHRARHETTHAHEAHGAERAALFRGRDGNVSLLNEGATETYARESGEQFGETQSSDNAAYGAWEEIYKGLSDSVGERYLASRYFLGQRSPGLDGAERAIVNAGIQENLGAVRRSLVQGDDHGAASAYDTLIYLSARASDAYVKGQDRRADRFAEQARMLVGL